jgi:hypothetical protein
MFYGTFKTLEEVATKFEIETKNENFIQEVSLEIPELFLNFIQRNLENKRNYVSENSICETIISPVLQLVLEKYNLPLWSHIRFDVSIEEGLTGIPDFLVAPVSKTGLSFTNPIVCIAEVKKENFDEGWTQALCEMIASQRFNNNEQKPIYGITTSGEFWKFGKLIEKQLLIDAKAYSASMDLQRLLNALNWFFGEAKKTLES